MRITGVNVTSATAILYQVSDRLYDGNLRVRTNSYVSQNRCTITLRVVDGAAGQRGARGSSGGTGTGPNGYRRTSLTACWHAHYDYLAELFRQFPGAKVYTFMATYTAETFHDRAVATGYINVGSMSCPVYPPDLCECDHDDYTDYRARMVDTERPPRVVPAESYDYGERYVSDDDKCLGKYASRGKYASDLARNPGRLDGLLADIDALTNE